jgi:hypothetical protein
LFWWQDSVIVGIGFGECGVTPNEETLIRAGNDLARALGHKLGCPKVSPAVPCTCGEGAKQAQALDAWKKLVDSFRIFSEFESQ